MSKKPEPDLTIHRITRKDFFSKLAEENQVFCLEGRITAVVPDDSEETEF